MTMAEGTRGIRHVLEGAVAWAVFGFFGLLSLDRASGLGGWLGRLIGPRLKVSQVARRNLARAFPEKTPAKIKKLVTAMWDNLGRVVAEYPHLSQIRLYDEDGKWPGRVTVENAEHIDLLRDNGRPGIFFSAHLGNWEITPLSVVQRGLPVTMVYRAPNNPLVDTLVRHARRTITHNFAAKGSTGGRESIRVLKEGGHLVLIADQKMNDGIAMPFFGREAMTAPAPARLALKFGCPLVPGKVVRTGGAYFRLTLYPPLEIPDSGDHQADVVAVMAQVNGLIEDWVRENPEQWMWVHRRWPD
jgi:KDO2-lipid IV(A) lauroyltransferase